MTCAPSATSPAYGRGDLRAPSSRPLPVRYHEAYLEKHALMTWSGRMTQRFAAPMPLLMFTALALSLPVGCEPLVQPAASAPTKLEPAMWVNPDATPVLLLGGSPVGKANFVFWGSNWSWAGSKITAEPAEAGQWPVAGRVDPLGLSIDGKIVQPQPNQLTYQLNLDAAQPISGIVGGGLEFQLDLESAAVPDAAGKPQLLAGNRGWKWPLGNGRAIEVRFEPAIARVYFEAGDRSRIRCMLVGSELPAEPFHVNMTIQLPEGGKVRRNPAQRYDEADVANWYDGALRYDVSPVDLSFLNHKPAGKHGMLGVQGDQFVFADGTPARFWGGNVAAYAIYSDRDEIARQAKRIAALGFNLMRIHHHDSSSWVSRTVIDDSLPHSQSLDAEVLDRLDWWIKCLKDEGVYVWLDLHVGRRFTAGDDIPAFDELADDDQKADTGEAKGYVYFNQRLQELFEDFNAKYLNHVNRYTGVAYKDEPAIMGLLLTNENDLTGHFGNLMLADKGNPQHHARFAKAARAFAAKHGLSAAETVRTWEPGASKIFLSDREHQIYRRLIRHLRQDVGAEQPIAVGQMWGNLALSSLPSLTAGDMIDVHSYGTAEQLSVDPRFESTAPHYVASGALTGYPLSITEWNVPYPAIDRFTQPWYMASVAALQAWDAPMIYNYTQSLVQQPSRPGTWDTFADPAITGVMPAAAVMFRQGHVRPAQQHVVLMLDQENLYGASRGPGNTPALRTAVERHRVTISLPDIEALEWDEATRVPEDAEPVRDLERNFIEGSAQVVSDTGQLTRNWQVGYQLIDSPKSQAAHGFIGDSVLHAEQVSFAIDTAKAAVAVTALDDQPIASSRKMLLTAVARAVAGPGKGWPMRSEPVSGVLTVEAVEGLRLVPLAADGRQLPPIEMPRTDGRYEIQLPPPHGTHWFLLTDGGEGGSREG